MWKDKYIGSSLESPFEELGEAEDLKREIPSSTSQTTEAMDNLEFKKRINDSLDSGVVSEEDLCHGLNISRTTLDRWKEGVSSPHPEMMLVVSSFIFGKERIIEQKTHRRNWRIRYALVMIAFVFLLFRHETGFVFNWPVDVLLVSLQFFLGVLGGIMTADLIVNQILAARRKSS